MGRDGGLVRLRGLGGVLPGDIGRDSCGVDALACLSTNGNDAGEIKLVTPKTGNAQFFKVSTIK